MTTDAIPAGKPSRLELLLVFLSREEFKAIFGLCFLADGSEFEHALDLRPYFTDGQEHRRDKWTEWIRATIRWLSHEHGFEFEFLDVEENGSIHRNGRDLCEPGNINYLTGLEYNRINYPDAVRAILRLIDRGRLALSPELFREALESMNQSVEHQERTVDQQKVQRFENMCDSMLETLGVVRVGKELVH